MKKTICLAVSMMVLTGLAALAAEQSPPAVVSVPSEMKRVVLVRLKYNTDLLEGLRQVVKDERITNAVILSGVGSVTRYHVHAVSNTTLPAKLAYSQHAGPMDLIAVNGYVLGGRIHAHITMTDDQKAFGGHLHEGTTVFTFAVITLGVLDDNADLSRFDDSNWRCPGLRGVNCGSKVADLFMQLRATGLACVLSAPLRDLALTWPVACNPIRPGLSGAVKSPLVDETQEPSCRRSSLVKLN